MITSTRLGETEQHLVLWKSDRNLTIYDVEWKTLPFPKTFSWLSQSPYMRNVILVIIVSRKYTVRMSSSGCVSTNFMLPEKGPWRKINFSTFNFNQEKRIGLFSRNTRSNSRIMFSQDSTSCSHASLSRHLPALLLVLHVSFRLGSSFNLWLLVLAELTWQDIHLSSIYPSPDLTLSPFSSLRIPLLSIDGECVGSYALTCLKNNCQVCEK